jgi:hypothetical protein
MPERGFLQYSMDRTIGFNASAGVGIAGGSLRASFQRGDLQRGYGLGYARGLARADLGAFGTGAIGVDLFGAYLSSKLGNDSRGARVSLPVSLRWGSPSALSMATYLAPYAEFGRSATLYPLCPDLSCNGLGSNPISTHASGLGAGVQLTAWRLGLDLGVRDALMGPRLSGVDRYQAFAGLRIRF